MNAAAKVVKDVPTEDQSTDSTCDNNAKANSPQAAVTVQMTRVGPSRPGKRPIKNVSPYDKVDAIERVHEGESKASVARDIGVPESTLRGWCKSEQKIRSQCNNVGSDIIARQSPATVNNRATSCRPPTNGSPTFDDEGPSTKRSKLDRNVRQNSPQTVMSGPSTSSSTSAYMSCMDNRNVNVVGRDSKMDYASLMASMSLNHSPEQNPHLAFQRLGMLAPLTNNILNNISTLHSGPVGLVENGLQYTRNINNAGIGSGITNSTDNVVGNAINVIGNAMGNAIDHGINSKHLAVAPAQLTSRPSTRKSPSVSPAAEAPSTPVPASPNENNAQRTTSRPKSNDDIQNKYREALALWMSTQRRFGERQSTNIQQEGSWYWQYLKHYSFPTTLNTQAQALEQSRAVLDNLMLRSNNSTKYASSNNADESHNQNTADARTEEATPVTTATETSENSGSAGIEEAIDHGDKFLEWLENCSIPRISRLQVVQFKCLLDTLKSVRDMPPRSKASRKKSSEPAQQ